MLGVVIGPKCYPQSYLPGHLVRDLKTLHTRRTQHQTLDMETLQDGIREEERYTSPY